MTSLESKVAIHGEQIQTLGREMGEQKRTSKEILDKFEKATIELTKTNTNLKNLLRYPPICRKRMDRSDRDIRRLVIAIVAISIIMTGMGAFIGFNVGGLTPPVWSVISDFIDSAIARSVAL